ncbi:AAA family ATPase [Trueperella abortisuis]|uniref:AAA family ATPase n=1 Tax=Trueperella abortisuis TaxID=445930 RepID=UPI002893128E|nr:AAA family ATPase [Trueperella abortisuis]
MSDRSKKMPAAIERITLNQATFTGQEMTPTYINFVFGKNGTGKSTIATALSEGTGVTWTGRDGHSSVHVRVFNRDFINRNISQLDGLAGVFTLGEKNIEIDQQVTQLRTTQYQAEKDAGDRAQEAARIGQELAQLRSEFEEQCWSTTQDLRSQMPNAFVGVRGSKQKFADYVLAQTTAIDHDVNGLIAQYRLAHDASATPCEMLDDLEVHTSDASILAEPIVSSVESEYAQFLSKLNAADWVRHGHTHYSQTAGTTCPYCQQTLPADFEQTLKACFDTEYDRKIQALDTFSRTYKQATAAIVRMPLSRDMGPMPEQADLSIYDTLVTALKDRLTYNLNQIGNKLSAPSTTAVLEPLDELVDKVRDTVNTINAAISEHNATVANQQARRQECEVKAGQLVAHMLDQQIRHYKEENDRLSDKQREARELEQDAKTRVSSSLREIHRLEATAVNTTAVMNQINEHLRRSGFQGFHLCAHPSQDGKYQVVRVNGSIAQELSEGEQNFIAFLYFYFQLQGRDTPGQDRSRTVVVIDDPVSSMDTDAIHIVASLTRRLIDECANLPDPQRSGEKDSYIQQIFILTHNPYFMDVVSRPRLKNYRYVALFKLTKRENQSSIEPCIRRSATLATEFENYSPVMNSYAAMWQEYREVTNPYTLLGVCQRILENYFLYITGHSADSLTERVLTTNRELFVDQLPGGSVDETALNHAQALLAQMDSRHNPVLFDDVYASTEINETQCRNAFETIFRAMGQREHFEMMTAQGGPT